ncbi:MAG: hypothetical protein ABIJ09_05455 [Pseudomonadota bacterium]
MTSTPRCCALLAFLVVACRPSTPVNQDACRTTLDCPARFFCVQGQCLRQGADASAVDSADLDALGPDAVAGDRAAADRVGSDLFMMDAGTQGDLGPGDAPTPDGGADASARDVAAVDAVATDGGRLDGTSHDAAVQDAGDQDAGSPDASLPPLALFALHPAIARAGDTIWLEGSFPAGSLSVEFAGNQTVPLTLIGAQQRLAVPVPAGAGSGEVKVSAGVHSSLGVWLRVTSFAPRLGTFSSELPQTAHGRNTPRLTNGRNRFDAVTRGRHLYLVGGSVDNQAPTSVQRAYIHADGSLGPFTPQTSLIERRKGAASLAIGDFLYAIGGGDTDAETFASVEAAPLGADGTLGSFVPTRSLGTARRDAAAVVLGSWLYVLGGRSGPDWETDLVASVERFALAADGSLGPRQDLGSLLTEPRDRHALAVVGPKLYVFGGTGTNGRVEVANITSDGNLTAFVRAPSLDLPTSGRGLRVLALPAQVCWLGGDDGNDATSEVWCCEVQSAGDIGACVLQAPMTQARTTFGLAVAGNRVWAVSGSDGNNNVTTLEQAPLHRSARLSAFQATSLLLPMNLREAACAVLHDHVYLLGGTVEQFTGEGDSTITSAIVGVELGPDGEARSAALETRVLPGALTRSAAAVFDDTLYVVGGQGDAAETTQAWRASVDPATGIGVLVATSSLAIARSGHRAVILGTTMHVVGGFPSGAALKTERLDLSDQNAPGFSVGEMLTVEQRDPAAAVLVDGLRVVGGFTSLGAPQTGSTVASYAAGNLDGFSDASWSLVRERGNAMSLVLGDSLYVLGGEGSSGPSRVERLDGERADLSDGQLGPYIATGNLLPAEATRQSCMVEVGNAVHLFGGYHSGSPTAQHFVSEIVTP